jgi:hypothetical protein
MTTPRKNQPKPNGHAGPHSRPNGSAANKRANGHAPASAERGGFPSPATTGRRGDQRAASDDAGGTTLAREAGFGTATGEGRHACAEAAPPPSGSSLRGKNAHKNGKMKKKNQPNDSIKEFHLAGSTDFAAMQDGAAYVKAVASRVDLVGASVNLVRSSDEKIAKAELDRLREMKFGKGAAVILEEAPHVEPDIPRPDRS